MKKYEQNRWSPFRRLAVALVLTMLVFGVVGVLVTLFAPPDRRSAPEPGKDAPQVRQVERDSLFREGRAVGH
jgi:hypothetical protein